MFPACKHATKEIGDVFTQAKKSVDAFYRD